MSSKAINEQQVHAFLSGLFGQDVHTMRVLSLSLATLGIIHAASRLGDDQTTLVASLMIQHDAPRRSSGSRCRSPRSRGRAMMRSRVQVTLLADRGFADEKSTTPPVFQLRIFYPLVSNDLKTPSHQANGQGNYFLGHQDITWVWKNHLGDGWQANKNAEALPLHANRVQLKGLPPAFIITGSGEPAMKQAPVGASRNGSGPVRFHLETAKRVYVWNETAPS
ncbi:alpha/beta hydrolase fold domain-containing protein [Cystobacter fuscus]